ncbi:hypothetical protein ACT8ZS_01680 [Paenibacillus sp. M.A.Huq-84]
MRHVPNRKQEQAQALKASVMSGRASNMPISQYAESNGKISRSTAPVLPSQVLQLQKMIGNRAVTSLLGNQTSRDSGTQVQEISISTAPAGQQPIQRYFDENGKWIDGPIPKGYVEVGQKPNGAPKFGPAKQAQALEAEPKATYPKTTKQQEEEIHKHPKYLERSDNFMMKNQFPDGTRKSFLNKTGLRSAGSAPVRTSEQMNNDSPNKPLSNAISTSNPDASPNRTDYGKEVVRIKLHKLMRAQLRGKPDAQGIKIDSTDDIVSNLNKDQSIGSEDRNKYINYANKDGEYHIRIEGPNKKDEKDTQGARVLRNRFLKSGSYNEEHDSDSDSEVEDNKTYTEEEVGEQETHEEEETKPKSKNKRRRNKNKSKNKSKIETKPL